MINNIFKKGQNLEKSYIVLVRTREIEEVRLSFPFLTAESSK